MMKKYFYTKKQREFRVLDKKSSRIPSIKDVKQQMGFSLIEMMVVVAVSGLFLLALVTFFTGGTKSWVAGQSQLTAQRNARQAMDRMIKEIREGEELLSGSDGDTIIVHFPDSFSPIKSDVTYNLSVTTINRDGNPLINNVLRLFFDYYDENGDSIGSIDASRVDINLQVDVDNDGSADIDLTTDVNLRNFDL